MANFFEPPKFENEDKNVRARLILLIAVGMIIAILIFVVVTLLAFPALVRRGLILAVIILPLLVVIIWLLRLFRLKAASSLLVATIWFVITIGKITAVSISAPITIGYFFVLTVSGLLLRLKIIIYVLVVCLLTLIIIAWSEINGWLPPAKAYSSQERVSIYSFFFVLMLGLQSITAGNIARLLRQARESETKYKSFLESIPTITYINSIGTNAGTEYVSPQVEHLLGYTQEEFFKDPLLWQKILHPDDR